MSGGFGHVTGHLRSCRTDALSSVVTSGGCVRAVVGDVGRPVVNLGGSVRVLFVGSRTLGIVGLGHRRIVGRSTRSVSLHGSLLHHLVHRLIRVPKRPIGSGRGRGGRPLGVCTSGGRDFFRMGCVDVSRPKGSKIAVRGGKCIVVLGGVARFGRLSSTGAAFVSAVSRRLGAPVSTVVVDLRLLRSRHVKTLGRRRRSLTGDVGRGDRQLLGVANRLLGVARMRSKGLRLGPGVAGPVRLVRCTVGTGHIRTRGFGVRVRIRCPRSGVNGLFISDRGVT